MQFNLVIKMDNAAYARMSEELGSNLEHVISSLGRGRTQGAIMDSNGNKTGYWIIDGEAEL